MKTEYASQTTAATANVGAPVEILLNHLLREKDRDDELFLTLFDILVLFLN
jgi:hypothetical protein